MYEDAFWKIVDTTFFSLIQVINNCLTFLKLHNFIIFLNSKDRNVFMFFYKYSQNPNYEKIYPVHVDYIYFCLLELLIMKNPMHP